MLLPLLEVFGRIAGVLLLRADAGVLDLLLIGAVAVFTVALIALVAGLAPRAASGAHPIAVAFADVRSLLRASNPTAPGHRQARAPGATF